MYRRSSLASRLQDLANEVAELEDARDMLQDRVSDLEGDIVQLQQDLETSKEEKT